MKTCTILALVFLAGCTSSRPANVKPVPLGIFEVVDCKTGSTPMTMVGSAEKYCLADKPVVNETDLRDAEAGQDESGEPQVLLSFTTQAGQRLNQTSTRMAQQPQPGKLAVVIDHKLIMAATVQSALSDSVVIRGHLSPQQAFDMALSLRAAAGGR